MNSTIGYILLLGSGALGVWVSLSGQYDEATFYIVLGIWSSIPFLLPKERG